MNDGEQNQGLRSSAPYVVAGYRWRVGRFLLAFQAHSFQRLLRGTGHPPIVQYVDGRVNHRNPTWHRNMHCSRHRSNGCHLKLNLNLNLLFVSGFRPGVTLFFVRTPLLPCIPSSWNAWRSPGVGRLDSRGGTAPSRSRRHPAKSLPG